MYFDLIFILHIHKCHEKWINQASVLLLQKKLTQYNKYYFIFGPYAKITVRYSREKVQVSTTTIFKI